MLTGTTGTQLNKIAVLAVLAILFPVLLILLKPAIQAGTSPESIRYALMDKSGLQVRINAVSPGVHTLAADSENSFVIRVHVTDSSGASVPGAAVKLMASIPDYAQRLTSSGSNNTSTGSLKPSDGYTDSSGDLIAVYTPTDYLKADSGKFKAYAADANSSNDSVLITARLPWTDKSSVIQISLIPVPVVFVHGYQATPDIFSGISEYLKQQGYKSSAISYPSENGVASAASALSEYLKEKAADLRSSGIQVKRFDLIAHSMGGLVARYYTCSSEYVARSDVRKLIFISVPQKGSPFASLGVQYYDSESMRDLVPGSSLYSDVFPSMINAGLNPSIQTGNLLGRYDEVVGTESARLSEWNIETEIFEVGDNNFSVDKLLNGKILQAANHKLVLYNMKVYERIQQMLEIDIPYPFER